MEPNPLGTPAPAATVPAATPAPQDTLDMSVPISQPAAPQADEPVVHKKQKPKESGLRVLLRIVITVVLIALGIFLILFLVAKAGRFDSIGSMLQHMFTELSLMWQRITA